jgi:hypothetical protein
MDMSPLISPMASGKWQVLDATTLLRVRMSKYFRKDDIDCIVSVVGLIEVESTFSKLSFIKNWLGNRLTTNFDFVQKVLMLEEVPYQDAITY